MLMLPIVIKKAIKAMVAVTVAVVTILVLKKVRKNLTTIKLIINLATV